MGSFALIVAGLLGLAAIVALVPVESEPELVELDPLLAPQEKAPEAEEEASRIALNPLEQVIFPHYQATGLEMVETMKMEGDITLADGSIHHLTLFFRRPNLARRILEQNGLRNDMGYDGQEVWAQQVSRDGEQRMVDNLSEDQKRIFREGARVGSALWDYEAHPEWFTRLPDTVIDGEPCHVIACENDRKRTVTYLGQDDFLERRREETDLTTSRPVTANFVFGDERTVSGVTMPHRVETISGGKVFSTVEVTSLEINAGVPSYIFEPPAARFATAAP